MLHVKYFILVFKKKRFLVDILMAISIIISISLLKDPCFINYSTVSTLNKALQHAPFVTDL